MCTKKKKAGRSGMDLWHILVLAVVSHATNTNLFTLESLANYHELIRQIMGVHNPRFNESERINFQHQTSGEYNISGFRCKDLKRNSKNIQHLIFQEY